MKVGDLIGPDRVIVGLRVADKTQLLQELAGRAATALTLNRRAIFDALLARENLGSTGLGKGFALPHARLEDLPSTYALFVRLARPIDFASIDERPVDLAILLLTPADGANHHLTTLATLSRPLRDDTFVRRIRQAPDATALHGLLASV
jgi:PTS system nitrogen regulatory IIA component